LINLKRIAIGSDHAGYGLKTGIISYLNDKHYEIKDYGCYSDDAVDYPDIAHAVSNAILDNKSDIGILICGTGIGVAMVANRYNGIRAAVCNNVSVAELARRHNDANILALGARVLEDNIEIVKLIIDKFLSTNFDAGRHQLRVEKIDLLI